MSLTRDILTNSAEFLLNAVEALVDPVEALVDPVEALVDPVEAIVDPVEAGSELCPRHAKYVREHLDSSFRARGEFFKLPLRRSIQDALDDDIDLAVQSLKSDREPRVTFSTSIAPDSLKTGSFETGRFATGSFETDSFGGRRRAVIGISVATGPRGGKG